VENASWIKRHEVENRMLITAQAWVVALMWLPHQEGYRAARLANTSGAENGCWALLPRAGSLFAPGEDVPGAERVVVLSEELWRRRFGTSQVR